MSRKKTEKTLPATVQPPHVAAAVRRFQEHAATAPPGVALEREEEGGLIIAPERPGLEGGIIALMDALGTLDPAFFATFVAQVTNASDAKEGPATAANAALAFVRGIKPRDETETCLAAQMYATHSAAMVFARRLNNVGTIPQQDSAINGFTKLTRTYAAQLEALKRYRSSGEQKVTVQHVTVSDGGQAIVGGTVTAGGGRDPRKEVDATS
jgi:hypothetical protein